MNTLKRILFGLTLSGVALAAAPAAYADKYVVNNHYYSDDYDDYDDDRDYRYYRKHKRHQPRTVVHEHYHYNAPPRERVVVVREEPRYYDEPRYYERPRYQEPTYYQGGDDYRSATPMIVGGIVGGLIGNQMGKGRGKDAATVAGVILGGSIGRDMGYRQ